MGSTVLPLLKPVHSSPDEQDGPDTYYQPDMGGADVVIGEESQRITADIGERWRHDVCIIASF